MLPVRGAINTKETAGKGDAQGFSVARRGPASVTSYRPPLVTKDILSSAPCGSDTYPQHEILPAKAGVHIRNVIVNDLHVHAQSYCRDKPI